MDNEVEVWKDVVGCEGRYMVSNLGNVKSMRSNSLLKPQPNNHGYHQVCLPANGGKPRSQKIHRLVATAFLPNPDNKKTVNHKDGNKTNNRLDNLEWATHIENSLHFHGNSPKTTRLSLYKDGKLVCSNKLYRELISEYKMTLSSIHYCTTGKRKTHKGYTIVKETALTQ